MRNSIITFIDYGDIVFDIKTPMDRQGITINQMVKRTGLHHQVIRRYYEGTVTRYDKDVLSKLCYVIDCDIKDIMYYQKPNK